MPNRQPWLDQLRRDLIVVPLQRDKRTVGDNLLGKQMEWIFNNAIGGGQADFDQPLGDLSPRDRAVLYAYLNQKTHVDELIHAFEKLLAQLDVVRDATVIDIGCGPFTAGLALANVVGAKFPYRYFGIDRAKSMLSFGNELAQEVLARGQMHQQTQVIFQRELGTTDFGTLRAAETTIVILSFLLASETVDVRSLVKEIICACDRVGLGRVIVLYTNSARNSARINFPPFKAEMEKGGFKMDIEDVEQFKDTDRPRLIHYALFVRLPVTLSLSQFK